MRRGIAGHAILAIALSRSRRATAVIYGATLGDLRGRLVRLAPLAARRHAECLGLTLPIGLPWLGAHFRLDALACVFPGRRQSRRRRGEPLWSRLRPSRARAAARAAVLPGLSGRNESGGAGGRRVFLSAVLGIHVAGVLGAGDGAPSRTRQRQGGLRLSGDGKLRHARAAAGLRPAGGTGGRLRICRHPRCAAYALCRGAGVDPDAARRRLEGRPGAVACLAAARPSGGAEPRVGADERRHDQGRDLRLHSRHIRSAGTADLAGERGRPLPRQHHRRDGDPVRHDGKGSQAPARLLDDRKCRHHLRQPRPCAGVPGQRHEAAGGARLHRRAVPRAQPFLLQEPAVLRRRRRADLDRRARHGQTGRPHSPHAVHELRRAGRLRRDIGAAAIQRLRLGMADLPGRAAEPGPAAMGPEDHGACGRRHAGAGRGAGGGVLRQGIRRRLSRTAAQRRGGNGARSRPLLARRDVHPRRTLPAGRNPAGTW